MSKQTAIEWLINELQLYYEGQSKLVYYEIIEQAKEMERIQNQQSFQDGQWGVVKHVHDTQIKDNNDKVEI